MEEKLEFIIIENQSNEKICTFFALNRVEAKNYFAKFHTKECKERGGLNIKMTLYCKVN